MRPQTNHPLLIFTLTVFPAPHDMQYAVAGIGFLLSVPPCTTCRLAGSESKYDVQLSVPENLYQFRD
ncbi:hypothetical protein ACFX2I_029595 [Malus domestica]